MILDPLTRSILRVVVLAAALLAVIAVAIAYFSISPPGPRRIISNSPEGRYLIVLLEKKTTFRVDRNFVVKFEGRDLGHELETIFESPDEGPVGSEEFYWSTDEKYVLLAGKNFYVREDIDLKLGNGRIPYLLYRSEDKKLWCNASQGEYEPIPRELLLKIDFGESVRFKESSSE